MDPLVLWRHSRNFPWTVRTLSNSPPDQSSRRLIPNWVQETLLTSWLLIVKQGSCRWIDFLQVTIQISKIRIKCHVLLPNLLKNIKRCCTNCVKVALKKVADHCAKPLIDKTMGGDIFLCYDSKFGSSLIYRTYLTYLTKRK